MDPMVTVATPLSDRDRQIIDLEASWWTEGVAKKEVIRRRLGISPTRYYQLLTGLVASRQAAAYDPLVILRIRREQVRRRRAQFEGRAVNGPNRRTP